MVKNVALVSLFAVAAVMAQDNGLHIDTPNGPVACQPTRITWGGGTPPYYVTIMKGGESSGTPLADLTGGNPTSETGLTWWVNLQPGTEITATIKDSTGQQNAAAKVSVASGGNTDCISKPLSVSIAGAVQTPSGSSNGETPSATSSSGGSGGGGAVAGGGSGGDSSSTQGSEGASATSEQQASQTESSSAGEASQSSEASSAAESSAAESSAAESGAASSGGAAGGAAAGGSSAAETSQASATPTSSEAAAGGASSSAASQSGGNAASSVESKASQASSGAAGAASSAKSGASALVPGFVAPALAALVAVFAL